MSAVTKVILLTGFLGSGKTSLLNRIIAAVPEKVKLEPGMIITNEPGLYIDEEEIGIRELIEDERDEFDESAEKKKHYSGADVQFDDKEIDVTSGKLSLAVKPNEIYSLSFFNK